MTARTITLNQPIKAPAKQVWALLSELNGAATPTVLPAISVDRSADAIIQTIEIAPGRLFRQRIESIDHDTMSFHARMLPQEHGHAASPNPLLTAYESRFRIEPVGDACVVHIEAELQAPSDTDAVAGLVRYALALGLANLRDAAESPEA
jgi:hypothetical protein